PRAVVGGEYTAAGRVLARASRVVQALSLAAQDRYLLDLSVSAERAAQSRSAALTLAHLPIQFRRGTSLYENNAFTESGRVFAGIRQELERAHSPLALSARLQMAISAYYAADLVSAVRELDALIPEAERLRYPRLSGLCHRMRGLLDSVRARFGDSL